MGTMSMTESATKQNLADDFAAPSEVGDVQAGNPLPIGGAHQQGEGVNFVLFSRRATGVRLEFYQNPDDSSPSRIIDFDPVRHRTGDVWHVWVRGIPAGQLYGYRVEGPYLPEEGHRFNPHKLLLDPYARAIAGVENWDFLAARGYDSSSSLTDLSCRRSIMLAPRRNAFLPMTISTGRWTRLQSIPPPKQSSTRHTFAVSQSIRVRAWRIPEPSLA